MWKWGKSAIDILWNDYASPFRKIPVADFPHSAFYYRPSQTWLCATASSLLVAAYSFTL